MLIRAALALALGGLASAAETAGSPAARARDAARAADRAPAWCRGAALRAAAFAAEENGDPGAALERLERALELDPDDLRTLTALVSLRERAPGARASAPPAPPGEAAAPDELEALRAGFEAALAGRRRAEAAALAERFEAAAETEPSWRRYDADRVSAEMWLALGDAEKVRVPMARLEDRDERAQATVRLWRRVYPEAAGGTGEGEWLAAAVGLRLRLGDAAGAAAAVERALARVPGDRGVLSFAMDRALAQGEPSRALALGERLFAAYATEPMASLLDLHPNHPALAGRRIPEKEQGEFARRDAGHAEEARRRRDAGRRTALETMGRISLALGRRREAEDFAGRLEKESRRSPRWERVEACRLSARLRAASSSGAEEPAPSSLPLPWKNPPARDEARELELELELARRRPEEARLYARCLKKISRADAERAARISSALEAPAAAADEAPALRALIERALAEGRPKQAVPQAERLIAVSAGAAEGDRADAHRRMAEVRRALGDAEGEKESLRLALSLAPGDAGALSRLFALDRGRREEALSHALALEKAMQARGPRERAETHRRTARIRRELGDADGAAESLARALALVPGDAEALRALADLELGRGRAQAAAALADRLVAAAKKAAAGESAGAYLLQARARRELGDASGAAKSVSLALKAAPGEADARAACASPILRTVDGRAALPLFDACLERFPSDPALWHDRGVARHLAGRAVEAREDFRRALALKPDFAEAASSLAAALAEPGRAAP